MNEYKKYNINRHPLSIKGFVVKKEEDYLTVTHKDESYTFKYYDSIPVIDNETINFVGDNKMVVSTTYRNFSNLLKGLEKPFSKIVKLTGTGYYGRVDNNILEMEIGYSHKVFVDIPSNITITNNKKLKNELVISSKFPQLLGNFIYNKIEKRRKYNPYTNKGITVSGKTYIPKKSGKKK